MDNLLEQVNGLDDDEDGALPANAAETFWEFVITDMIDRDLPAFEWRRGIPYKRGDMVIPSLINPADESLYRRQVPSTTTRVPTKPSDRDIRSTIGPSIRFW